MITLYTVDYIIPQRLDTLEKDNSGKIVEEGGVTPVKEAICFQSQEETSQQTAKLHNSPSGYSSI